MKASGIKTILFSILLLMMLLPAVQQFTGFPKVKALKGYFVLPQRPKWSFQNYLESGFQDSLNKYAEHHIGYRPDLVRLHNQFRYLLFDTVSAAGVLQGKDGYLFEMNYFKAYFGLDFVGYDTVAEQVRQTKVVNDWLRKHQKHLLVALAPGKATFFPEYIPDDFAAARKPGPTNESVYDSLLRADNIPVISGNRLFLSVKDTSRFALFPQCGIHWSYYGLGLMFDTILSEMSRQWGKPFVKFGTKNIEVTDKLRSPDRDLWEGLNLFSKPNDIPMPYPDFTFEKLQPDSMPSVIVVADSYYWQWYGSGYASRAFGKHDFWYYNKQIIAGDGSGDTRRQDVDLLTRVLEADFILLLQTDANMSRFSFGFIKELYAAIASARDWDEQALAEIQQTMERIRKSPDYMKMITEKAARRNITVDEMLRIDATWVYQQKQAKKDSP